MIFAPFAFNNIIPSTTSYDPDAQAFFTAAGITNTTEKTAVNQLVLDLKSYSIWDLMFAIYPFVGGTSTTTSYNLKNTSTYQITWNGGVTFASTGVKGNGSNAYGQTNWVAGTVNSSTGITTSFSYSVYSRTNSTGEDTEMGVDKTNGEIQVLCKRTNGNAVMDNYQASGGRVNAAVTNSLGHFISSRTAINSMKAFRNAVQFGSTVTTSQTASNLTGINIQMFILAGNDNGTPASYSNRELAFSHLGLGLSDTNVSNLNTSVATFQTTLGRNV